MKIELGVTEIPYPEGNKTTVDVAQELEEKYGILTVFVRVHKADIKKVLEQSFVHAFEEVVMGLPPRDPYASGLQQIQVMMRRWLSTQEVERQGIPGVPTRAALLGVSHRYKSGLNRVSMKQYAKGVRTGTRRPSFIDYGLYEIALRAWQEMP